MSEWLSAKEVASILGFSHETLRKWRYLGGGPPYSNVGRSIRYRRVDVESWMRARANARLGHGPAHTRR